MPRAFAAELPDTPAAMLQKLLKTLHEFGAIGVTGAYAACLVLIVTSPPPTQSLAAYAASRAGIAEIARWLLVPSLALATVSGLLAIAANKAYTEAGWAWTKALLGISMFEGTLLAVAEVARHAAELSALSVAGHVDPLQVTATLRSEWRSLGAMLALALANVVLGVWRPRLGRRTPAASTDLLPSAEVPRIPRAPSE